MTVDYNYGQGPYGGGGYGGLSTQTKRASTVAGVGTTTTTGLRAPYILSGDILLRPNSIEVSPDRLTVGFRAGREEVKATWRQFDAPGGYQQIDRFGGSFRLEPRNNQSPITIQAPPADQPAVSASESVLVQSFSESQAGPDRIDVDLTLARTSPRDPQTTGQTDNGTVTLATSRGTLGLSERQVGQVTSRGTTAGPDYELELRLTPKEAGRLLDAVATPAAIERRTVPDGSDIVRDTSGGDQTVTVSGPPEATLPDGDFGVSEWSMEQSGYGELPWRVTIALAEKNSD
jgi:hypothetical protein